MMRKVRATREATYPPQLSVRQPEHHLKDTSDFLVLWRREFWGLIAEAVYGAVSDLTTSILISLPNASCRKEIDCGLRFQSATRSVLSSGKVSVLDEGGERKAFRLALQKNTGYFRFPESRHAFLFDLYS